MELKLVKCPHCGGKVNVKSTICPHCGGRRPSLMGKKRKPMCPRCNVFLNHFSYRNRDLDICPQCGGVWLDRGEFKDLTREGDVYQSQVVPKGYIRGPIRDSIQYIPCIRCGALMNRKNFAKISGVIIDECKAHGVWLDGGELERIRTFIADGGLERAQDKEIEKNRQALRELASNVSGVQFSQRMIHFWNPKRWIFTGWR
ncbi:MAG: zf-TFIIB domain-containing protein [Syntrophobacterales bacterium]|nr:MAG: zf-TFIIB domain-containing protein [Syntrophobacterales bacterium]